MNPSPERARIRLRSRGVAFLALTLLVGASAALSNNNFLFLIATLLLGIFISGCILAIRMMRGIRLARQLPNPGHACEPWEYLIHVHHTGRRGRRSFLQVRDGMGSESSLDRSEAIMALEPNQLQTIQRTLHLPRRGTLNFSGMQLSCQLPLGLMSAWRQIAQDDSILVYPQRRKLSKRFYESLLARETGLQDGMASTENEEFAGVREFRAGDNPRHIHWKTSARLPDQLFLRQFDRQGDQHVVVALDTSGAIGSMERVNPAFEDNICFVQAFVEALIQQHASVSFCALGPLPIHLEITGDIRSLLLFKRSLALIEPDSRHSAAGLINLAGTIPGACRVFVWVSAPPAALALPPGNSIVLTHGDVRLLLQDEEAHVASNAPGRLNSHSSLACEAITPK